MSVLSVSLPVDNSQWTSYKKLWMKLKIVRNKAKKEKDPKLKQELKEEEIEISKKLRKIAPLLTDRKGTHIAIPMFPILGGQQ